MYNGHLFITDLLTIVNRCVNKLLTPVDKVWITLWITLKHL